MVKNSNVKMEEDKQKIIQELIKNSRESPNNIAKKLGFSRQKAWKYVKELEKEGKIWGYTAVTDRSDNNILFFALIKQRIPYLDNASQIIGNIKNNNSDKLGINLIGLYYTNGGYDGVCIFEASDLKEAKKYLGYMMKEYSEQLISIDLLESVFPMIHFTKPNPKLEKLKEFSINL